MSTNDGQTLRRAMSILKLFEGSNGLLTTRDVLARSELPKTTTLRLLGMLRAEGLLYAAGDGYFGPGPTLMAIARTVRNHWQVSQATEDVIDHLAKEAQETSSIFVMDEFSRVCIAHSEAVQAVRYVVSVGERLPLWCGAASFVLLSDKDRSIVDRVIAGAPKDLLAEEILWHLRRVRETGIAISHGTREPGLSAVAAPVVHEGQVVAAVSVSGPTSRFTGIWLPKLLSLTREAAAKLSGASPIDHIFTYH